MLNDLVNRSRPLPAGSKMLILGGGFSGSTLATLLRAQGTPVICTRRNPEPSGTHLCFDSDNPDQGPKPEDLEGTTHVLSTIPPSPDGREPVLTTLLQTLQDLPLRWVGYLSTTGVYGDRGGDWVSEADPATPGQDRSRRRLACENAWQQTGLPMQILRLPGIYGPKRSVINGLQQGRARMIHKTGQVFCRIHVEDIAGACLHLIHKAEGGAWPPVVNISDDCPAPSEELLGFAADLIQMEPPPFEDFDAASQSMSAMARSFWSENRRVSNHLLRNTLEYELLHPDFRVGLRDCWLQDPLNPNRKETLDPRSTTG